MVTLFLSAHFKKRPKPLVGGSKKPLNEFGLVISVLVRGSLILENDFRNLLSLLQHKNSKNNVVRSMAAKYIHFTVERIGIGRALSDIKDMTDKIIQFTAGAYQDPSPDVRFWGKKVIILLSQHHGECTLDQVSVGRRRLRRPGP